MSFNDREEKILSILREKSSIRNAELSKLLYVSVSTLRRDLEKLEDKNLIIREHGTSKLVNRMEDQKYFYHLDEQQNNIAKSKIAKEAVEIIKDGDNIMIDGSSTAFHLVQYLDKFRDLLVISNSAKVSMALSQTKIYNISTGGQMAEKTVSFVGQEAIEALKNYNADIVFFSCRGINEEGYLTDTDKDEVDVRRAMLKRARKKIALVDSTKIGKSYLYNICHVSEVNDIISEKELPEYLAKYLKKN